MSNYHTNRFASTIIDWYKDNKRDLPWRHTTDPYYIWLSEVILQQTRVDQGMNYYLRFVNQYPTVLDLAAAHEDDVLKLWQGLGYYSRARNLHATAQIIAEEYKGVFPHEHKDILKLKGVGEYTAAAIASFAYDLPHAAVDGNVYRVLSRVFAIDTPIDTPQGKKIFAELAQELLDQKRPGIYNQAIMEFGALQCTPTNPNCNNCPLSDRCMAYAENKVSQYPQKAGKTKTRNRYFNYLDVRYQDSIYLQKRIAKDIWHNLYELILIETESPLSIEDLQQDTRFQELFAQAGKIMIQPAFQAKHILSHQNIYANFYTVTIETGLPDTYLQIKRSDMDKYAISRLVERYLEQL